MPDRSCLTQRVEGKQAAARQLSFEIFAVMGGPHATRGLA